MKIWYKKNKQKYSHKTRGTRKNFKKKEEKKKKKKKQEEEEENEEINQTKNKRTSKKGKEGD